MWLVPSGIGKTIWEESSAADAARRDGTGDMSAVGRGCYIFSSTRASNASIAAKLMSFRRSSRARPVSARPDGSGGGASILSPVASPRSTPQPRQAQAVQRNGRVLVSAFRHLSRHPRERERRTVSRWQVGQVVTGTGSGDY